MSDYSVLSRLLHRFALSLPVAEMLHDLERLRFLKTAPEFDAGQHVFVTGLARAGTTLLMRELFRTGTFATLTYADMPFVLAPNLWQSLSSGARRKIKLRERAHGDGIKVDIDSPEALDEVYWRLLSGVEYITPDGLLPHHPGPDAIAGYSDLIRLVLRKNAKTRYLSKNNNTILRLGGLADAWQNAIFLVPLRQPLQHAESMLNQHQRFLDADGFTTRYMTWLAHHEFGATHRPFLFEGAPQADPLTLDYWLRVWTCAYQHIHKAALSRPNIILVPYEDLCEDPKVWAAVLRLVGLEDHAMSEARRVNAREVSQHDPEIAARATEIYSALYQSAKTRLEAV